MLLRNQFSSAVINLYDSHKMTAGFNMFVDIEITQLAQLITRASWAKGNITSGAHSDRGIKRLPSSLIRKTKQTRKTLERRSVSSSKAFSNLYKGFKSQTITPKRAI